jgi:uncharacterized protein involved in outer membrane biogenesis
MKTFFASIAGFVVVIAIVIAIALFIGYSRLPDFLANQVSKKLQVPVNIGSISLGFKNIKIKTIEIGNPPGTLQPQAFKCQEIDVQVPLTHFFHKHIVIDAITVNNVFLDLEFDSASGTKGNWSKIMGNLQASSNQGPKKPKTSGSGRSVLIRSLVLTNIDVDVVYLKDSGKVKHLPRIDRIELTDISSEEGVPMDQILNSVLGQMLKSVFIKENLKNMMQDLIQNPPSGLQKFIGPFKGLLNLNEVSKDAYLVG